jgi:hypothetical protein
MIKSNALIIGGQRVFLPTVVVSAGGTATNYLDDAELHLAAGPRKAPLTTFVLHETAGNSAAGCKATLAAQRLGVHLVLDKDGTISCHADLADEVCWHAGQANGISVGIEVVNAYRPEQASGERGPVVPAAWWTWVPKGAPATYQAPTARQMAVVCALVPWLCDLLDIPAAFPTAALCAKKPQITGWRKPPRGWSAKPGSGIVAHRDFSAHADGRYLLEQVMQAVGA